MKGIIYEEYVKDYINGIIIQYGGCRSAARKLGINQSTLSKYARGVLVPRPSTFNKLFNEDINVVSYVIL